MNLSNFCNPGSNILHDAEPSNAISFSAGRFTFRDNLNSRLELIQDSRPDPNLQAPDTPRRSSPRHTPLRRITFWVRGALVSVLLNPIVSFQL